MDANSRLELERGAEETASCHLGKRSIGSSSFSNDRIHFPLHGTCGLTEPEVQKVDLMRADRQADTTSLLSVKAPRPRRLTIGKCGRLLVYPEIVGSAN